ncbi:MAG TPA: ATP-binding protein [Ignavibacteriaceae bacterium]|nr:ATP-binding protein [Ignavibacteriaceae bacterium]
MTYSFKIKNDISELSFVKEEIDKILSKLSLSKNISNDIHLVVEEAVINVISYAFQDDTEHEIEILVITNSNLISIEIIDDGMEFDPINVCDPTDLNASLEDRKVGGLGIYLIKKLMDEVNYKRFENKNILTLIKHF